MLSCLRKQNVVGNADGGRASQAAVKAANVPGTKARHNREEYSLTCRVFKKSLDAQQKKMFDGLVKKSLAVEYTYFYKYIGGDNAAEGCFGHNKNSQRRVGLLSGSHRNSHINALYAQWLLEDPTLEQLLKAMAMFRRGANGQNPDDAFETYSYEWLFENLHAVSSSSSSGSK